MSYIKDLAGLNNHFAFDLYHQLAQKKNNLFMSPLSISETFAMVYVGAKGKTKEEIKEVLHFYMQDSQFKESFKKLGSHLSSFNNQSSYTLRSANAIWPEKSFSIEKNFNDDLKQYFSSSVKVMNYSEKAKDSTNIINDWIAKKTNSRIKNMVDAIDPETKLILTNAIYFKAKWLSEFDEVETNKKPFYLHDNKEVEVDMMHQSMHFNYLGNNDYQAVVLPYSNRGTSMTVILPQKGKYDHMVKNLSIKVLYEIEQKSSTQEEVVLSFPKYKITTESIDLIESFTCLGMKKAFDQDANFNGISDNSELFISSVLHKAFIEVNEKETEAAAATLMGTFGGALPTEASKIKMIVNRPFIIIIQDDETKQILFMGNIVKPQDH